MRSRSFILGAWPTKLYIAIEILFGQLLYGQKESVPRQRRVGTRGGVLCPLRAAIVIVRWKSRPNVLMMSTMAWIVIGVAVVILAVVIETKIKDRYF
jgi:hypothetical protein